MEHLVRGMRVGARGTVRVGLGLGFRLGLALTTLTLALVRRTDTANAVT